MLRKQRGFTLPTIPSLLIAGGLLTYISLNQLDAYKQDLKAELSDNIRSELVLLVDGLQACYGDTRAWCDFTKIEAEYGGESGISITNNVITALPSGQNLDLSVNTNNAEFAAQLTRYFPHATATGSILKFTVAPPTASHLFQNKVQRFRDDAGFQRNTIDQALSFNNNDVKRVDLLQAEKGSFDSYSATEQSLENLKVNNQLSFISGSLQGVGNTLAINTPEAMLNGNVKVGGAMYVNGSISGIEGLQAEQIVTTNTLSASAIIDDLRGTKIDYTNADIGNVTALTMHGGTFEADTLNLINMDTDHLEGNLSAREGYVEQLHFNQGSGVDWRYGSSIVNSVNSNDSFVGAAKGDGAEFSGNVTGGAFKGGTGRFVSLHTSGNVSGDNFNGNDFCTGFACLNSNKAKIDNHKYLINQNKSKIYANTISASSNTSKISLNTNGILLNERDIEKATSDIATNTRNMTSNKNNIGLNTTNISKTTSAIANNSRSITSNTNNIDRINPSIQSAQININTLNNQLANCMDVTQFCHPQDPSVNLSCSGCSDSSTRTYFSATVAGYISDCRQGCSYRWELVGINGTCNTGTVARGGSKNISCNINATAENGTTVNGSAKLIVTNTHYSTKKASDSEAIRWSNTTPNLVSCPSKTVTQKVERVTAKFVFPLGTEGDTKTREPESSHWGCAGGVSHVEGEADGVCKSNGEWDIVITRLVCLSD